LNEEIRLLENNIGFFSKSKSASGEQMRKDVEKKIDMARAEVKQLEVLLKEFQKPKEKPVKAEESFVEKQKIFYLSPRLSGLWLSYAIFRINGRI
jgi:hypothetical protein